MIQLDGKIHNYYFNYKITFMCNQNCDYCYEMQANRDIWNAWMIPYKQAQADFKLFKELEHPSMIEILGGEPLLYPRLNRILEYCSEELPQHTIAISTNATGKKISDLNISDTILADIKWMFSWHAEYTEVDTFVINCMHLLTKGIPLQINIMLGKFNLDIFTFLDSLPAAYQDLIQISWLELFDPESKEIQVVDDRYLELKGRYTSADSKEDLVDGLCYYNEVFIDRGQVQSPECVLDFSGKFDSAFINSLDAFLPRKCPFESCRVINADLCRPGE